jgi:hypothetical protein
MSMSSHTSNYMRVVRIDTIAPLISIYQSLQANRYRVGILGSAL